MRIVILNWRSPFHKTAGGAEKVTFKYATHWSSRGHQVIWISSAVDDSKQRSQENIQFFFTGPNLMDSSVSLLWKFPYFLTSVFFFVKKLSKTCNIDLIVDEIHGLPFFSPMLFREKKILLVCEVAGEIWDKMFPYPLNIIGKAAEKLSYRLYRKVEKWAISESTKKDVIALVSKADVKVLPLGISCENDILEIRDSVGKTGIPSGVFLARLVKMKGVEFAIESVDFIKEKYPEFVLYIIGSGEESYVGFLQQLIIDKKLGSNIKLLGEVTEKQKYSYLSKTHFLIHPSFKEGFGLTILEAGLMGTPSIVRGGSNLEQLVSNGHNGFCVNSPQELAKVFTSSVDDSNAYGVLSANALSLAKEYEWRRILEQSSRVTGIS